MSHRLFFALWPGDEVRARIDAAADGLVRAHVPGGRRVRRDRLHLTVRFLGDFATVPDGLVEAACAAASRIGHDAFDLTLDTAGSFRVSRVWWLGCREEHAGLTMLWQSLGRALGDAGVLMKPSHRFTTQVFTPHVTVLRDVPRVLAPAPIEPVHWAVPDFVLIDSRPGAGYVRIGCWPLRG